ncbi:hypothetical protein Sru01_52520 [Sphaerisporangium rufum]|uniref:Uncharacterized protein n=1 Tax=Sphaerisporangium rufum TaxID=1381558 RepID=A0A919RAC9_9ACTN|nr:hypothetical protein [Sphaerisporangium rufum]GII80270.1 hypothetical protein Sru01_52520 [Sphaerisporangium rufum]
MGYELRVDRDTPVAYADLTRVSAGVGLLVRGTAENGEVVARYGDREHPVAVWAGRLYGTPTSDWAVAQLARLAGLLGGRLVGEDGEAYLVRDGVVAQVNGDTTYEFGRLEELLALGPAQWTV